MFSVFLVGGENDGQEVAVVDDLADAINAAYKFADMAELGAAIWDDEKDEEVIDW